MFQGNTEVRQAAAQQLLEVITHLTRARQAMLAIAPVCASSEDKHWIESSRDALRTTCEWFEDRYIHAAAAFKETK